MSAPDAALTAAPLPFSPSLESSPADEAGVEAGLADTMLSISRTTFEHSGHAMRSVHAKSHGFLRGTLIVPELPPELAQGLFARPAVYPVVIRLSTTPGDVLDDNVSMPRGMALKVVGVSGARLPGSEDDATQDFVLGNSPAFNTRDAAGFLAQLRPIAATTDRVPGLKKAVSALSRGTERVLEAFGGKSATLVTMAGQRKTHILGDTFYSQAALLYGENYCKVCVAPVSPGLVALSEAKLDLAGKPDGLREAVNRHFGTEGGEWELRVQLATDAAAMPIEDASIEWPEDRSPYRPVARIVVAPQEGWSPARSAAVDDGLAFNPWHGLSAHRPLGSIMRTRRLAYARSASFRAERNGRRIAEPRSADDLPI